MAFMITPPSQFALPRDLVPGELSFAAVLGLSDPRDGDWARLRGPQYASLARVTLARLLAHALAAALVFELFLRAISIVTLAAWTVGLGVMLYYSARLERGFADADRRRITPREIKAHTLTSLILAAVWSVPLLYFATQVAAAERQVLWMIVAMLITGLAVLAAAAPLASILFSSVLGAAGIVLFATQGDFLTVFVAIIFVAIVCAGTLRAGRVYLAARMAEASVAEKSEVVSLLLREFEEGEADWLWQTDAVRRLRVVSPRFAFALGLSPQDMDGRSFIELIAGPAWQSGHFHSSLHDLAERLKRRESFSNLLVRVNIAGQDRWWELSASPKLDENGRFDGFRGVGSDVTEKRESSEKIAFLARYDTLTGLPNRLLLTETLGLAMRAAEQWRGRCAFLMIDLDRFKAVNDTLGHLIGDQLLARVSDRLKSLMTDNELCGRLGGDEFAIVIRDASEAGRIEAVANAVIEALSRPYQIDHHTLFIGASVGSAVAPRDGASVETLMRNADLALYRAKEDGGGCHFTYEPSLHARAEERRQLEFALRRALEKGEFALSYQPVVDAESEQVVSFEALIRWNSEEHGPVSPAKFIPLAEDTRLIVPIGEWVLRQACHEAMNWPDDVKVAVNVSGEQLLQPGFSTVVVGALAASGLPARRLEIEVTESIFVRDGTAAQATLEQIRALGCGIALDDFGTGYSSLGYLRTTRFSTIKVDRSFVRGAAHDTPESVAIIRAVVAMADSLGMSTTAEGVETEKELATISKLGCKKVQGYLYGRPMAAADARAIFTQTSYVQRGAA